jgi:hypothetical protein
MKNSIYQRGPGLAIKKRFRFANAQAEFAFSTIFGDWAWFDEVTN